ncbi:MAG: hypothetical protein ABSD49_01310 [Candidatus Bathyarchaeia archaeon]
MCQCGCGYPQYPYYSPYPYYYPTYAYPLTAYNYAYYGLPVGYVYTSPTPLVATSLQYPRGEHHVGNCLMICQ